MTADRQTGVHGLSEMDGTLQSMTPFLNLTKFILLPQLCPTLTYPYKHRAARLLKEGKGDLAASEMDRALQFLVTPDLLEFRVYCCISLKVRTSELGTFLQCVQMWRGQKGPDRIRYDVAVAPPG